MKSTLRTVLSARRVRAARVARTAVPERPVRAGAPAAPGPAAGADRAPGKGRSMRIRVATYNIHKGVTQLNRRLIIHELRERLKRLGADVVFLQEVQAEHHLHANRFHDWPVLPQYEYLADTIWNDFAYGRNAVYTHGHHGNAILSRYPILAEENLDISAHGWEQRGLLHCEIGIPGTALRLHCINVHLGLVERWRRSQIAALSERIEAVVPRGAPLIVAGDFNDWRHTANRVLREALALVEVFEAARGRPARTYPSFMPLFRLDRIYARGLGVIDAGVHYAFPGARLSDHAALTATLTVPDTPE
jgi:endonuclease/exonuclease/phosphatase family metal-dependent hydrolase